MDHRHLGTDVDKHTTDSNEVVTAKTPDDINIRHQAII